VFSRFGESQIPSFVLDGPELFLPYDSKDAIWGASGGMKFEVQRDDIGRAVTEVIEAEKELVDDLEWVVARSERKHGV